MESIFGGPYQRMLRCMVHIFFRDFPEDIYIFFGLVKCQAGFGEDFLSFILHIYIFFFFGGGNPSPGSITKIIHSVSSNQ